MKMTCECSLKGVLLLGLVLLVKFQGISTLECYACDSAIDVECATKPGQQLDVEECREPNDECVTAIAGGHTRRGCLSRLHPNKYCPAPCERCSTNLCNRNVYPADRLRCYQCVGADCIDVSKRAHWILPCPVYHESDRCYANVIGINNVQRGCEHTNLPPTCPNTCFKCNYDGCNNELGVWQDSCLECVHTLQRPNPECVRQQEPLPTPKACHIRAGVGVKRCSNKLLHGHLGKCYSYINEQTGVVQRGCSSTKGFFPTGNLSECTGNNCNNECFGIACNICNDASDPNCRSGVNLLAQKCEPGTVTCYSCEAGARLRRGCWDSAFDAETRQSQEACLGCANGDGCNRTPARTCYHCNSLEQPDCANWVGQATNMIQRTHCQSADELCVSTVVSKLGRTFTLRGCESHVPECTENDPLCVRCNGSLCNNQPTTRQQSNARSLQLPTEAAAAADEWQQQRSGQAQRNADRLLQISYLIVYLFIARYIFIRS